MEYECIGLTGFAGDRTPEAMLECHKFTESLANYLTLPYELLGTPKKPKDLLWHEALHQSKEIFETATEHIIRVLNSNKQPILVTPRCATAIATLPIMISKYPDIVILYFDAHGDLHTPESSTSSYLGGMPIAAALGEWDSGYGSGLKAKNLVHIGGRDIEECEKYFIEKNNILTVSKEDIEGNLDVLKAVINHRPVFIHLDTDVFDPTEVTAEYAVDDGLFSHHVHKIVDLTLTNAQLVGIEITELSPKNNEQRVKSYSALFESFKRLKHSNIG